MRNRVVIAILNYSSAKWWKYPAQKVVLRCTCSDALVPSSVPVLQAGSLRFAQLFEGCTVLTKGTRGPPDTLVVVDIEMLPPMLAKVEDKWESWRVISVPPYNM